MKNLLYISKPAVSEKINDVLQRMSQIWRHAKKANSQQEITGVLVYKSQYFLQILEGPAENIDALMQKIQRDMRHTDLTILFENTDNKERSFPEWPMRLLASCNDAKLIDFINTCLHNSPKLPKHHRTLLKNFYDFPSRKDIKRKSKDFSGFDLKISTWPNFNTIKPSIALIDLCALLSNSYQNYNEVLLQHSFSNKKELDKMLNYLHKLGVLEFQSNKNDLSKHKKQKLSANKTDKNSFYEKMKTFLKKER